MREPDFNNLLKVLNKKVPDRPTLFEFFLNDKLYRLLAGYVPEYEDKLKYNKFLVDAFKNAGYDYADVKGSDFSFPAGSIHHGKTISLNEGSVIHDRESFEKYKWQNPEDYDYTWLDKIKNDLPDGMKLIVWGPGGVLENVTSLVGYDNLCYMLFEDPELVRDIFDAVGSRLLRYYEICSTFDSVGALISNDDWGFNTSTLLNPRHLRKYVFPWHKKIVQTAHSAGKPAILHSCGNLKNVMEDMIEDMKYDAKHSYEDKIMPVEDFYEKYNPRIAVLGGIDVNFVCHSTPEEIKKRSRAMIERAQDRGGYALGTGNSVPEYVPIENYLAMISVISGT